MAVDVYSDIDILKGMSMLEKIARFFVLIGEDSTVKIFQFLDKDYVEQISTAITQIQSINKDVSLAILEEFHLYTRTKGFISSGGYDFAKEILKKSIGQEAAEEVLEKLFQLGENISTKGTRNEPGSGLGLLICNEFLHSHDSKLQVESEKGKGSSFSFILKRHN